MFSKAVRTQRGLGNGIISPYVKGKTRIHKMDGRIYITTNIEKFLIGFIKKLRL